MKFIIDILHDTNVKIARRDFDRYATPKPMEVTMLEGGRVQFKLPAIVDGELEREIEIDGEDLMRLAKALG